MSTVTIKILTPVHIGSGKTLTKDIDFVIFSNLHNKPLVIIDEQKIFNIVTEKHFDKWMYNIENPKQDLLSFIRSINSSVKPEDIHKRIAKVQGNIGLKTQIHEQIHNAQIQPYLPGSSLKGAIRTAVLSCLFNSKKDFFKNKNNLNKNNLKDISSQITTYYVADNAQKDQQNKDFFRFLHVSDAVFKQTNIVKVFTYNKGNNEWEERDALSQWTEVISSGYSTTMRIQTLQEKIHKNKKPDIEQKFREYVSKNASYIRREELIQNINHHTQKLLQKEQDFLRKEDDDNLYEYREKIQELLDDIKQCKNNECILRVGKHTGFNSITGGWQEEILEKETFEEFKKKIRHEKYKRFPLPKTRRFLSDGTPLGFVKLIFEN